MLKVVQGGFEEGIWLHDRDAYSDESIANGNKLFKELIDAGHTWLKDYLWDIKPIPNPELRRVK